MADSPKATTNEAAPVTATFADMLATQPEAVQKYLLSKDLSERHDAIARRHGLDEEARYIVLRTEMSVFFGLIPLAEFPDAVWSLLDWPDDKEDAVRALVLDVMGEVFLPAQEHVGDVVRQIAELGGDPSRYASKAIEPRVLSIAQGTDEILRSYGTDGVSPDLARRLRSIVESRLRDLRDDLETRTMLTKARKTGGAELSTEDAKRMLEIIGARSVMTRYVESEDLAAGSTLAPAAANKPAPAWTPARVKALYMGSEEERADLATRVQAFKEETNEDPELMVTTAASRVAPAAGAETDTRDVVVALVTVAEAGLLATLRDDTRAQELVAQFSSTLAEPETGEDDVRSMSVFLQLALRGTAALSEDESARFGIRILNAAKRAGDTHYAELAYFDATSGVFRWKEPIKT